MLSRYPNRFAAGVPIAGVWPDNDFDASTVSGQPVWAFHARDDSVVSPSQSRRTIERLLKVVDAPEIDWPRLSDRKTTLEYTNADLQLSYTEWPTGGHGIWFRVYETQEMYDWMFAQTCETCPSIPASTPPQPQRISVNDVVYKQDFDEALGIDATDTTVALPTGASTSSSGLSVDVVLMVLRCGPPCNECYGVGRPAMNGALVSDVRRNRFDDPQRVCNGTETGNRYAPHTRRG